jgi:glycerol-3-phosphate acyltransferase PlsY
MLVSTIGALVGAYIVGSIPVGYLIARWHGIADIRRYGTGVIGATNVSRMLGLRYFFVVLFLDTFKAYSYIMLCSAFGIPRFEILLCAFALLLGNSYPLFLGGNGGKGVATLAGIMFALNPELWIVASITWLLAFAMMQNVGIASVIAALLLPLQAMLLTDFYGFLFIVIVASWVIWRHRTNIRLFYVVR